MHYDRMLSDVFQQLCAYPFPFGSANMQWVADASDAELRRLSYPRLRDQAVSIFGVFEQCKGEYCALWRVAEHQGMTPYLAEEMAKKAHSLVWIQGLGRRVRALLDAAPRRAGAHGLDRHRRCWGGACYPTKDYGFKRWYPEQGLTTEQYEKLDEKWNKIFRELGRKS